MLSHKAGKGNHMKALGKSRTHSAWRRSLCVVAPVVFLGCVVATNVAHSQPPDPTPSSTSDGAVTPTPTPTQPSLSSAGVAPLQAAAAYTGTVTITSPIRRADITVPSVPLGTADWQHRRVNVAFSQPVPTGATVQFVVLNAGARAGDARVVEDVNRRTNGTITLEGVAQTEPGAGGTLKVACLIDDAIVGQSDGFSVCAHPNGLNYKFIENKSAFQQPINNDLFWGALYGNYPTSIGSDSGNAGDLSQVSINERIIATTTTGIFAGGNFDVGNFNPAIQGIGDLVGVTGSNAASLNQQIEAVGTSQLVGEQYHVFACARCGIPESGQSPKVSNSGFRNYVTVSKSSTGASRYYVRCRKSAFDGNGVARGTVDNNLTQTIEIK
jgi:hypothetical protein